MAMPKSTPLSEYVKSVFPGLQPPALEPGHTKKAEAASYPDIEFANPRTGSGSWWALSNLGDSLAHLIRGLTDDASFDDILLASQSEKKAVVLFQRSDSTPKLRDISELIKKPESKDSGLLQPFHRFA